MPSGDEVDVGLVQGVEVLWVEYPALAAELECGNDHVVVLPRGLAVDILLGFGFGLLSGKDAWLVCPCRLMWRRVGVDEDAEACELHQQRNILESPFVQGGVVLIWSIMVPLSAPGILLDESQQFWQVAVQPEQHCSRCQSQPYASQRT